MSLPGIAQPAPPSPQLAPQSASSLLHLQPKKAHYIPIAF